LDRPLERGALLSAILWAGLVSGILDITAALISLRSLRGVLLAGYCRERPTCVNSNPMPTPIAPLPESVVRITGRAALGFAEANIES